MSSLRQFLSILRRKHAARAPRLASEATRRARQRFRHSMLGEPGLDEAVRLFGVGR
jgi:hypothetical protein